MNANIPQDKLETILANLAEGVIVIDQDGRLALVNQTARSAFNLGEANLVGKRFGEVLPQSELLEVLGEEQLSGPTRTEISLEDGRVLNALITPIPEVGVVVTMQDITHLKELDNIKSDFVNTVSHDLRSPLTAILGYVELIERVGPVTEQQHDFIRRIQLNVHNITALINDLLDLGRIEAGFDARKEIVPIETLVRFTVESLQNRAAEKRQTLQVDAPAGLPRLLGNPVRMKQLLTNLVGNAIEYTQPEGHIQVKARAESEQVILQVVDDGPGIPLAEQPYIFDKFYRASNAPLDSPGTGLGLAIVKSIVENHQGRIWVESAPGAGATFTVVLPIATP